MDEQHYEYLLGQAVGIELSVSAIDADSRAAFSAHDDHKANILRAMAKSLRLRAVQARQNAERYKK